MSFFKRTGSPPKNERSTAGPMDFEFENGIGPVDSASPFLKRFQSQNPFASAQHRKRPASETTAPVEFPSTRPLTNQTSISSNTSSLDKSLPKIPNTPSFRNARNPKPIIDSSPMSIDSQIPRTPNNDADNDASPDTFLKKINISPTKIVSTAIDERKASPKKRGGIFSFMSPSRRASEKSIQVYSRKVEGRIARKRAANHKAIKSTSVTTRSKARSNGWDSDSDLDKAKTKSSSFITGTLAPFFKALEDHPNIPALLISYLQVLTNLAWILFIVYLIWSMWRAIVGDVNNGVQQSIMLAAREITNCKHQFIELDCDNPKRSIIEVCDGLARCQEQDPTHAARGQISARTFAKIVNDFADQLSLKAMLFYTLASALYLVCVNTTLNGLRNKFSPSHYQYPMHAPPATPQRFPSNGMDGMYTHTPFGYYTAGNHLFAQQHMHSQIEPGPSNLPE